MKLIAKIWRKTFPDAKTVNKMIEYSVKKWFNRDFPEIVQTYIQDKAGGTFPGYDNVISGQAPNLYVSSVGNLN